METLKANLLGFILSIVLTLTAYFLVANHMLTGQVLILAIAGLALIQVWIQLIFFLHLDGESSRWNLLVLLSTIATMLILVVGSIWIINNLNYRHNTPIQTDQQIFNNEAIPDTPSRTQ